MPRAIVFALVLLKAFLFSNSKGGIPIDLDFERKLKPKEIRTYNQTRQRKTSFVY